MAENWKEAGLVLMRSAGQESNINLPNVLTLVRILLIPVFVMLLIDPTPDRALSAAIVFVVAAVTDLLDGYVARKTGQITKLGRLLDPIADKLLVLSALILLVQVDRVSALVAILIIAREVAVTGLRAIAASEGLIMSAEVTGRTPFDDYRDALAAGDRDAAARYPLAAQRGLKLFVAEAGCDACHGGPNFSDGAFHRGAGSDRGGDAGRHADLAVLNSDLSRRLARYADAPQDRHATAHEGDRGAFRTPSLRNVEATAPYLHDGSADTLREAVAHRDAGLDAAQRDDLIAFLRTLTDADGARRPTPTMGIDCAGG